MGPATGLVATSGRPYSEHQENFSGTNPTNRAWAVMSDGVEALGSARNNSQRLSYDSNLFDPSRYALRMQFHRCFVQSL